LRRRFAIRGELAIGNKLVSGAIVVDGERIVEILRTPRDGALPDTVVRVPIVAAGLIDLQVNGGFGVEIGWDPQALQLLARRLPETGVTSYLPTLISSSSASYRAALEAFESAQDQPGARALGLHLEGPYLSPERKGAHPGDAIKEASQELFEEMLNWEQLRLVTIAPERPGSLSRIRQLRERGVHVSLGHTDASLEEFETGVDAGAEMVTHLYNAMSPFQHRAPGAIGAALTDDRVTVGLIADGVHCHPASIQLAVRAKGIDRVALVSDMMAAAGMPAGEYQLGGRPVSVDATSARLADGTLAGTILTLDQAVRNTAHWVDVTQAEALLMATAVPARLLDLPDRGRIVSGGVADLALFDSDLQLIATLVGGRVVWEREPLFGEDAQGHTSLAAP
jgi:N-acetylglucosamine-6-phosphate deacetylase